MHCANFLVHMFAIASDSVSVFLICLSSSPTFLIFFFLNAVYLSFLSFIMILTIKTFLQNFNYSFYFWFLFVIFYIRSKCIKITFVYISEYFISLFIFLFFHTLLSSYSEPGLEFTISSFAIFYLQTNWFMLNGLIRHKLRACNQTIS